MVFFIDDGKVIFTNDQESCFYDDIEENEAEDGYINNVLNDGYVNDQALNRKLDFMFAENISYLSIISNHLFKISQINDKKTNSSFY